MSFLQLPPFPQPTFFIPIEFARSVPARLQVGYFLFLFTLWCFSDWWWGAKITINQCICTLLALWTAATSQDHPAVIFPLLAADQFKCYVMIFSTHSCHLTQPLCQHHSHHCTHLLLHSLIAGFLLRCNTWLHLMQLDAWVLFPPWHFQPALLLAHATYIDCFFAQFNCCLFP